ncbi:nuclear transport factor 2 family protein [Thalassotalea fusca]
MWKSFISTILVLVCTTSFAQGGSSPSVDFQQLKKSHWSQQELKNAKLIADFVQNLMNDHNFDYVLKQFNDNSYVQHNRNIPDKIAGLVGFLREFVQDYPEYSYEVKHIYVDGDFVIFHSHATLEKVDRGDDQKGMNIIDTWRINNGKIVEHWDSIQALDGMMRFYFLMTGGTIRNTNGVF